MMQYKGYLGKVEFDGEAEIFHGEVVNTRDVITFQGESVSALKKAFCDSIDDYLAFCKDRGETPDKPLSGQFVTRIPPDLHRRINLAALSSGMSLNAWVAEKLEALTRVEPRTAATPSKNGPRHGNSSVKRSADRRVKRSKRSA